MKRFIYNNYNLNVNKIYFNKEKYYFFINNEKIEIKSIKDKDIETIDKINDISIKLLENGFKISIILINNQGKLYTKKGKYNIVLLKYNYNSSMNINLIDINKLNIIDNFKYSIIENFSSSIDDIEQAMIEYNKEYPLIRKIINYVIGVSENAISILNKYKNDININNSYVSFKIDYEDDYNYQIIDPFNIIFKDKTYNTSVYIKKMFYDNIFSFDELDYLEKIYTEKIDRILLFCNLLFCDEYFSLIKQIIMSKYNEDILKKYVSKINNYNSMLKELKNVLNIEEELYYLEKY